MKLLSFFKLTYLLPTSLFLLISIVIAFLYMITFLNEYSSDENIDKISSKSVNKDWTLISSIQELLSRRIQLVFDYLITSKLYLNESYSNYENQEEGKQKFVNDHLIKLKDYYISRENFKEDLDKMAYIINETDDQINLIKRNLMNNLKLNFNLNIYIYIPNLFQYLNHFIQTSKEKMGFH